MAEYIEREAVLSKLLEYGIGWGAAKVKGVIQSIPAADVAPVRRGRWEWAEGHEGITCSVCGKRCNGPRIEWKYRYNVPFPAYCENCGADMRGGRKHD